MLKYACAFAAAVLLSCAGPSVTRRVQPWRDAGLYLVVEKDCPGAIILDTGECVRSWVIMGKLDLDRSPWTAEGYVMPSVTNSLFHDQRANYSRSDTLLSRFISESYKVYDLVRSVRHMSLYKREGLEVFRLKSQAVQTRECGEYGRFMSFEDKSTGLPVRCLL